MKKLDMQEYIEKQILESYESMYRLAYTYVKNKTDAMDVVQDSVYKAISNCNKVKHKEYVQTWLCKIVINTALSLIKKNKKVIHLEEFMEEVAEDSYIDVDLMNSLEVLNDKEKSIIVLRYFEDMKIQEVADILDENVNSIKSILYRALKKLKIVLEEGEYQYEK